MVANAEDTVGYSIDGIPLTQEAIDTGNVVTVYTTSQDAAQARDIRDNFGVSDVNATPEVDAAQITSDATLAASLLQQQTAQQNALLSLMFNVQNTLAQSKFQQDQALLAQKASLRQITEAEMNKLEEQKLQEQATAEKASRQIASKNQRKIQTRDTILTSPLGIPQQGGSVLSA